MDGVSISVTKDGENNHLRIDKRVGDQSYGVDLLLPEAVAGDIRLALTVLGRNIESS